MTKSEDDLPPERLSRAGNTYRPIDQAVVERAAALLRAAGEPGRLRLLDRLSDGPMCVSELSEESGDEISLVSQRLRTLRAEGLVARHREGKHVFYRLADEHIADLVRTTLAHAHEDAAPPLANTLPSTISTRKST